MLQRPPRLAFTGKFKESLMALSDREKFNLPPRLFLYTIDQIADLLMLEQVKQAHTLIHFDGRSPGVAPRDKMIARNIMPSDEKPEWRVEEIELIRWMKYKRIVPLGRVRN